MRGVKEHLCKGDVSHNTCQDVVEIVGNSPGKETERLKFFHFQLFFFESLLLGDVTDGMHQVLLATEHERNKEDVDIHLLAEGGDDMKIATLFNSCR